MEELPKNNTEQENPSAAIPQASLGVMLREAREQLGLSVADVAAQTKFATRQIEALEADDFESLPETAFLRGFVRSYAKILNLDAQILLEALPQAKAPTAELKPASVDVPFPVDYSAQKNLILLGAALLMAVIVAGFAVWHFMAPLKPAKVAKVEVPVTLPAEKQIIPAPAEQESKIEPAIPEEPKRRDSAAAEKPAPRKEKAAPAEMMTPAQSGVPARHKSTAIRTSAASGTAATTPVRTKVSGKATSLRLVFDEESWTEITDADGNMLSSQINPSGTELDIKGYLPLSLVIGHAATTHLYQDGKPIDLAPYTNSSSEVARITLE